MPASIWFNTLSDEQTRSLGASDPLPATADVLIVGAGIIGLAAAYYLSAAGVSGICVVDRATALGEASGANAGGLWYGHEAEALGPLAPLAQASSRLYDELAKRFDFDLQRSGLIELLWNQTPAEIDARQLRELEPALAPGPTGALLCPCDGQLNPAKLGAALVAHLRQNNVKFGFHCEAPTISAGVEIIAAGAWTPLVTRTLGWSPPIKPMRGQLLATEPLPPLLRHTIVGKNYYYWQLREGHLAGGGTIEDIGFERGVD
ncbi:MAG: NAD(P)/FAD-dependent oxidoreductase, partial [Dongiaceae bacterium]